MKEFEATIPFKGTYSYEPSNCPWNWRGSGVYDKEAPYEGEFMVTVFAESGEKALETLKSHSWESDFSKKYSYDEFEIEEEKIVMTLIDDNSDEEEGIGFFDLCCDMVDDPEEYWEPDEGEYDPETAWSR